MRFPEVMPKGVVSLLLSYKAMSVHLSLLWKALQVEGTRAFDGADQL